MTLKFGVFVQDMICVYVLRATHKLLVFDKVYMCVYYYVCVHACVYVYTYIIIYVCVLTIIMCNVLIFLYHGRVAIYIA